MIYLDEIFPEVARQETVVYYAQEGSPLPEGYYAFIESYCPNPECDCKEVTIQIELQKTSQNVNFKPRRTTIPTAVLMLNWNKALSEKNPFIHPRESQLPLAQTALKLFHDYLLTHPECTEKFRNHYSMVKKEGKKMTFVDASSYEPSLPIKNESKVGRNELCSCGSGKKFKKCCLMK